MKVLLTGATGFVGSHILDSLSARSIPTVLLLRPASDTAFIKGHLPGVEVRHGSITESASLRGALRGITRVIHCAGCTRSIGPASFYEINHRGTRNLVEAVNAANPKIQRVIHISSLAAAGPGTPEHPAVESDRPEPISVYGESKLAGEIEVRDRCTAPFTIIRPPAVYGPRDRGFFSMFKAINNHVLPRPNPRQTLSLVFVKDLAEVVASCLDHPAAVGKTYFTTAMEMVTGRMLADEMKAQIQTWALPLPLPSALLWTVCLFQDALSRILKKPHLLSLQKHAELRAPGWVCDASLLTRETGLRCTTNLKDGIALTLDWYRKNRWL